jgi:hypothetical protein
MENSIFRIEPDEATGGLKSLILKNDPAQMNWIRGLATWGMPKRANVWWGTLDKMEFLGMEADGERLISRYAQDGVACTVTRTLTADALCESYVFTNTDEADLFIQRGEIGIYTTFEDRYDSASVSKTHNGNVHLWCGRNNSWLHVLKQGEFPTELGLFVTAGEIEKYSVERLASETSNDRGDFILHPPAFHLHAGESYTLSWEIRAFPQGQFTQELLSIPSQCWITCENETVFSGETLKWQIRCGHKISTAVAGCNGTQVPIALDGDCATVEYLPLETGEYNFEFEIDGAQAIARGICVPPIETLLAQRIAFIIDHQQCNDAASPMRGAYLIYDNEEHMQYASSYGSDRTPCQERYGMALLICKWLQSHDDVKAAASLARFEEFLLREAFDPENGTVYNDVGKRHQRGVVRLYNAPWVVTFWMEMYLLKGKVEYLTWAKRTLYTYYRGGGSNFYPNGCEFPRFIKVLRDAGQSEPELEALVQQHIANFVRNGTDYPEHEVRYEQTIITPAATMFASWYSLNEPKASFAAEATKHIRLLDRFQGHQPDAHQDEIAIRHWDGFWFGKRRMLGDTFPHYWSCLTGYAYLLYSRLPGGESYRQRAWKCLRNCLCLFTPEGEGSCAYLYPYSVALTNEDGSIKERARRGEYFDPYANDQDWALYFWLRASTL